MLAVEPLQRLANKLIAWLSSPDLLSKDTADAVLERSIKQREQKDALEDKLKWNLLKQNW